MDLIEFFNYFKNNDIDDILKSMNQTLKGIKPKLSVFVNLYCTFYANTNLWLLYKVHSITQKIEEESMSKKQSELLRNLCIYLKYSPYKEHSFNIDVDINDIHEFVSIHTHNVLPEIYSTSCNEHVTSLLNIFYKSIMIGDTHKAITIVYYLFPKPNKDVFITKGKNDILWIIFDILLSIDTLTSKCRDYVGMAKDMFFYKIGKCIEDRKRRLPILLYSLVVITTMKTKYIKPNIPLTLSSIEDRMSYLYVYTYKDDDVRSVIDEDKYKKKQTNDIYSMRKPIQVCDKEYEKVEKLRQQLHIIRMK